MSIQCKETYTLSGHEYCKHKGLIFAILVVNVKAQGEMLMERETQTKNGTFHMKESELK